MSTRVIPARDDANEFTGFRRADRLFDLLEDVGVTVAGRRIADLGTGYGFLSLAAAQRGADVLALDADPKRVEEVRRRATELGVAIRALEANLLAPPAGLGTVDAAFLIGVVEYAGLWDDAAEPSELQRRIFRTAYDLLEPGGVLVFGSKNRLWPRFVVGDVHTQQPLVNALPRRLADRLSRRMSGAPYRHHIHGPRGWETLLERAGFRETTTYLPYFSYQFPLLMPQRPTFGDAPQLRRVALAPQEHDAALSGPWRGKAALMAAASAVGLPLSHSVIIVARK